MNRKALMTLGRDLVRNTGRSVPWSEVRGDLQEHDFERNEIAVVHEAYRSERALTYPQAFCPTCGVQVGPDDVCPTHGVVSPDAADAVFCYWCGHPAHAGVRCRKKTPRRQPCPCPGRSPF
jgi:hypothetical protein